MNTKMPVGIEDFKEARDNYYVVDKTKFICQLIDNRTKVSLFTRPRRFGKTLTMSMLEYFFSIDKKEESFPLFQGLYIERVSQEYMAQRGKYPVIFISLKECGEVSWDEMYQQFTVEIQNIFQQHRYILSGEHFKHEEKEQIQRFLERTAEEVDYKRSLQYLSRYLYLYFGVKPIILIDEYDAPLQYAHDNNFYDEAIQFFRRWFSAALKGNDCLEFAVMTGVLRIAKESIFSGLNNLSVYSVLDDAYSDVFGFTEDEVIQMANDIGHGDTLEEVKKWYDGYTFGKQEIYNPWSVICYFNNLDKPAPYWVNTSGNSILKELLQRADIERMEALQKLIDGASVSTTIDEGILYSDIGKSDSALYSMMLNTGYLKATHLGEAVGGIELYNVKIPNEEIKQVYKREILENITQGLNVNLFINFQIALLHGEGEKVTLRLEEILLKMASFYDMRQPESFYHGLLLGMTCLLEGPEYQVVSNRESGYGRFDLAVFPTDIKRYGIILEFKVASSEKQLENKAKEALAQIEEKNYVIEFQRRHIMHVWKYGIAFWGKRVMLMQGHNSI